MPVVGMRSWFHEVAEMPDLVPKPIPGSTRKIIRWALRKSLLTGKERCRNKNCKTQTFSIFRKYGTIIFNQYGSIFLISKDFIEQKARTEHRAALLSVFKI